MTFDEIMKANTFDVKCVGFEGLKPHVKFVPTEVRVLEDYTFVRLNPRNASLIAVVCDNNPHFHNQMPKSFSLSCCDGLTELIKLRNAAQAASLAPKDDCKLFESQPAQKEKKKKGPRMTLQKKAENRRHATTIVVQVCLEGVQYDVEMVRPLHGRDGVWVRYDADTLSVVVRFMRALGFSEPRVRDTPSFDCKGIYKRTDGFVVDCSRTPLGPKYKKVKTLEDAYKVLALSREPLDIREGNHEDVTAEMPSDDQLVLDDHQDGLRESLEVGDPRADCQEGLPGLIIA